MQYQRTHSLTMKTSEFILLVDFSAHNRDWFVRLKMVPLGWAAEIFPVTNAFTNIIPEHTSSFSVLVISSNRWHVFNNQSRFLYPFHFNSLTMSLALPWFRCLLWSMCIRSALQNHGVSSNWAPQLCRLRWFMGILFLFSLEDRMLFPEVMVLKRSPWFQIRNPAPRKYHKNHIPENHQLCVAKKSRCSHTLFHFKLNFNYHIRPSSLLSPWH